MPKAILGKKIGMTQVFMEDGRVVPVTVIEAGPCIVVQKKTEETDGYSAIQVGYGEISERKVNKPLKGHFAKMGVEPKRFLREFRGAISGDRRNDDDETPELSPSTPPTEATARAQ